MGPASIPMNNEGTIVDGKSDNYNDASFAAISNAYSETADREYDGENEGLPLTKS